MAFTQQLIKTTGLCSRKELLTMYSHSCRAIVRVCRSQATTRDLTLWSTTQSCVTHLASSMRLLLNNRGVLSIHTMRNRVTSWDARLPISHLHLTQKKTITITVMCHLFNQGTEALRIVYQTWKPRLQNSVSMNNSSTGSRWSSVAQTSLGSTWSPAMIKLAHS